jgi:hypothetical protein
VSITVNGRTYGSWAEVPPDDRALLASMPGFVDADGDGVPDLLQRSGDSSVVHASWSSTSASGSMGSWDDLPADLRSTFMGLLGQPGATPPATPPATTPPTAPPSVPSTMPVISSPRSPGLVAAVVVLAILVVALAVLLVS